MLPIHKIIWHEAMAAERPVRQPEPAESMDDPEQVRSYVQADAWGGPTSALQLCHLRSLANLIRPGDTVIDLACGPGPLLLDLAPLYPDVHFIGVDLSTTMLDYLRTEAAARKLSNISVLQEDIRTLHSFAHRRADVVISTSALHHLPTEDDLRATFHRIASLLGPDGALYLFDFGLLRSEQARSLFVADIARSAPPLTVRDYDLSLQAAFPLDFVLRTAAENLPGSLAVHTSAFVDFFYFIESRHPRTLPPAHIEAHLKKLWSSMPLARRGEHLMLRSFRRRRLLR